MGRLKNTHSASGLRPSLCAQIYLALALAGCVFETGRGGGGGWSIVDAGSPGCVAGASEPCACAGAPDGSRRCQPGGVWSSCVCAGGCQPQCLARACGDDGCGGSCGACGDGQRCDQGQCRTSATSPPCPQVELGSLLGDGIARGTTAAGALRHTASCVASSAEAPEVTFGWTAPSAGRYTFSTEGSTFDTVIALRDGGCEGATLACEDDSAGLTQQSRVTVDLRGGQRVVVAIDGFDARAVGVYSLSIQRGCAASCAGRRCGDDGCGGSCGQCPSGSLCSAGGCVTSEAADPCGGAPVGGRCASANSIELCAVDTGTSTPRRIVVSCVTGETCRESAGEARCVLAAVCRDGETRCAGSAMQRCGAGQWSSAVCNGTCEQTALGAQCVTSASATRIYSGRLQYHYRAPNSARRGWETTTSLATAQGFLLFSSQNGVVLDTAVTSIGADSGGRFSIRVPTAPGPNDAITVVAAQADARGAVQLAVAIRGLNPLNSPSVPTGCRALTASVRLCDTRAENPAQRPGIWSWSVASNALPGNGELEIRPELSEPARLLDWARYVFNRTSQSIFGRDGDSLVIWYTPGVKWDCGNCANRVPYSFPTGTGDPLFFGSQIWMSGGPEGVAWAEAVVTHELGHWTMSSYGRNPGEGGAHSAGEPVFPGMAWSEGWATFHNADARQNALYLSVESSNDASLTFAMWGANLDARAYENTPARWTRPSASAGLLQRMDENEVSALLWRLSRTSRGAVPLYNAMAAPRSSAPNRAGVWERGYTRTTWLSQPGVGIVESSVRRTNQPAPMLADVLDALRCNGFPAPEVDAVLSPATFYPYPSGNPLCRF